MGSFCILIIVPHTRGDLPAHARLRAYRLAQLKVAVRLAQAAFSARPARLENLDTEVGADRAALPRFAYIGQIFSRQRKPEAGESILYGADTDGMLPTLLHPNEWLDGALLPSYHASLGGAETYFYQNHPVINALYRRHRACELNFVGTVATIASAEQFRPRAQHPFCRPFGQMGAASADAAVLTKFGGGVPHTDLSETARLLEMRGRQDLGAGHRPGARPAS